MEELLILKTIKEIVKKPIWRDKILIIFFISAFLLNLFLWAFVFLNYKNLKEVTILHYSVLTGIDRIDRKEYLFEIPTFGLFILILNLLLSFFLHQQAKFILSYFLGVSSLIINIFLILSLILVFSL